ncbi:MAG: hypothetical protein ACK44W_10600 [Planctomycetota bacterium]
MKVALLVAVTLLSAAGTAGADDLASSSGSVFGSILKIIVKWIFPVCAAYCFLHGVIGKGVKRGEWDMAAICTVAAVALALFPKLLTSLFQVPL